MRVVVLSVGSRGDVEPFCALTRRLWSQDGCEMIDFFVESNHRRLVSALLPEQEPPSHDGNGDDDDHYGRLRVHYFPFSRAGFVPAEGPDADNDDHEETKRSSSRTGVLLDRTVRLYEETIFPCLDTIYNVAQYAQYVVSCNLTNILCLLVKRRMEQQQRPLPKFLFVQLQPLTPNTIFPCYRTTPKQVVVEAILDHFFRPPADDRDGNAQHRELGGAYWDSYWTLDVELYRRLFRTNQQERQQQEPPPPASPPHYTCCSWEAWKRIFAGHDPNVVIVNAYSKYLIPTITTTNGITNSQFSRTLLGPNVVDVGPLADNFHVVPPSPSSSSGGGWNSTIQQQVEHFFTRDDDDEEEERKPHQPVLCIGFGSMPFHRKHVVLEALKLLGYPKTMLIGDALRPSSSSSPSRNQSILHVPSVPYPWLFQNHCCSMMVCHGGMGVVSACLRAGIPTIVCPLMGDQFLTGSLVQGLGLGRQACRSSLNDMTSQELADAVRTVQASPRIAQRCQRVAALIQQEPTSGADRVVNWIMEDQRIKVDGIRKRN
jgi:hypothetical protein